MDIYALGMIFFELFYPFATEMERISTLLSVQKLEFPARFMRELHEEVLLACNHQEFVDVYGMVHDVSDLSLK